LISIAFLIPNALLAYSYLSKLQDHEQSDLNSTILGVVYCVSALISLLGLSSCLKKSAPLARLFSIYVWAHVFLTTVLNIWRIIVLCSEYQRRRQACSALLSPPESCYTDLVMDIVISALALAVSLLLYSYFASAVSWYASDLREEAEVKAAVKFSYIAHRSSIAGAQFVTKV